MLGKLYKKAGKLQEAAFWFSAAMELDTKNAPVIKQALDALHQEEDDDSLWDL